MAPTLANAPVAKQASSVLVVEVAAVASIVTVVGGNTRKVAERRHLQNVVKYT